MPPADPYVTINSRRWTIGRAADCDYVISHAHVSSHHAVLEEQAGGRLYVTDSSSSNGTYLNLASQRINQSTAVTSDDLIYFSRNFSVTVGEILRAVNRKASAPAAAGAGQVLQLEKPAITVGRDSKNDVVLQNPFVSRFHARLNKLPDGRIILTDLGSTHGTAINQELIRGCARTISTQDKIEIGGMTLSLQFSGNNFSRVGVQREGIHIVSRGLSFQVSQASGKARHLLQNIDFAINPGEFVGLMGPSGCGKTTLLNILLGMNRMTAGSVEYNGMDVSIFKNAFGSLVGYVPQEDLLHAELTVRETLYYQAKLRLPTDVSRAEINRKIDRLCERLGLYKPGSLDVRDVLVGSPERKGLSGGQRKRLSLAIELLTEPKVLYLDEPTSGLSSHDTRVVMDLLKEIATEQSISIIITIHQPSLRVYRLLDKVIYLKSGQLGFFGQAFPRSISYFVPHAEPEVSGPDGVMEELDQINTEEMAQRFRSSADYRENVIDRYARLQATGSGNKGGFVPKKVAFPRQFLYLLSRYLTCRWQDKISLLVLLVQSPLVAALMCLVFKGESPQDLLTVLFLLGFISLWFGVNNSAREIVGELALLRREKRADLNTTAYLFSKIVGQGVITLAQVALLLTITLRLLDQIHLDFGPALAVCWSVSLVGIAMGLAISATVKTQVSAVVTVPLVLIPIILLGGMIKPFPEMKGFTRFLADVTPVRWSFEMLTALTRDLTVTFFTNAQWWGGAIYMAVVFGLLVYYGMWKLKRV